MMSIATDIPQARDAVETCRSSTTQAIRQWLEESAGGERRLDYATSALEWCRRLPKLADMLPAAIWQRLLNHLLLTAVEAEAPGIDASSLKDDSLVHQLLAGELALTLASRFPRIKACRRLLPRARRALSAGLINLLDGEGLLHAGRFDHLRPLLACWTRCRSLGERWKRGCWSADADAQYRRFLRNALRFARRDGSSAFSHESAEREDAAALAAALEMVGRQADHALAAIVLSGSRGKKKRCNRAGVKLPRAAIHSEWAATAVLRPDWSRSAPCLTVLYPGASCRVELACGKDVLWSGDWSYDLRVDGMSASPVSDWCNNCWVSDEDVDYLELEIELVEGFRLQRHIVMARKDRFLLLADAVLGPRRAALDYRSTLPLGPPVAFKPASKTTEGALVGRKERALVVPLALPEWRDDVSQLAEQRGDSLPLLGTSSTGNGFAKRNCLFQAAAHVGERRELELRQSAFGRALFAPLFFDLDPQRFDKPLTWRQLTVAESLLVQPADVAAGYRVSIGGKHWLFYRSLTPSRNRTLLGHNLSSETLIARFTRKGEVRSLIEIEQAPTSCIPAIRHE
jgi:hypothetical protein